MKKFYIIFILLCTCRSINAQTISLGTDNEYCPYVEYEFAVTLPGKFSSIFPVQMQITKPPYDFNQAQTSFKFKAIFNDVNVKQFVEIHYTLSGPQTFKPEYKRVKSLFFPAPPSACGSIQPKFTNTNTYVTNFTAPSCQVTSFSITFDKIKWYTSGENQPYCFGSISDYEYLLPAGWKIGNTTSTGSNWIPGTNNVVITSDLSSGNGSPISIRPKNTCSGNTANGSFSFSFPVLRPNGFNVVPASTNITCGSATPVTFEVENTYNATGITNYTWNLGTTPNGWLLPNGSPAPASYSTGTSNTVTLTPVCGVTPASVGATVTVNGTNCTAGVSTISVVPPSLQISGSLYLCSNSATYSLPNVPCNANVTWSAYPAGIVGLVPSGNSVTVQKLANGAVTLTATANVCNNYSTSMDIQVGAPPQFDNISCVTNCPTGYWENYCTNTDYHFFASPSQNSPFWASQTLTYHWSYLDTWSMQVTPIGVFTGSFVNLQPLINFPQAGNYIIQVAAMNSCGLGSVAQYPITVLQCYGWRFKISPNPAKSSAVISFDQETIEKYMNMSIREVVIVNKLGDIIRKWKYPSGNKQTSVNISFLKADIYYIKVFNGKEWKTQPFRKQ